MSESEAAESVQKRPLEGPRENLADSDRKLDIARLDPSLREFVQEYTGLPADEIDDHIIQVRDRLYSSYRYPRFKGFRWLKPVISDLAVFPDIIERLKQGESLLDVGTFVGTEIRKLISEGAPSDKLYGTDPHCGLWKEGYELWMDKDTLKATFVESCIFEPSADLQHLYGRIDMVFAGSFFHLFHLDEQVQIAKRIVQLLRPQKGSMVIGRQLGNLVAGEKQIKTDPAGGESMYRHNAESWREMWKQVEEETETEWEVEAEMMKNDKAGRVATMLQLLDPCWDENTRRLLFTVHRR